MSSPSAQRIREFAARLRDLVGDHAVREDPETSIQGVKAALEVRPSSEQELRAVLALCGTGGLAVCVLGGGTKAQWGNCPKQLDLIVSTRGLTGVLDVDADDLTLTASAGSIVADARCRAREAGRVLPLDPGRPRSVTIGGVVATADQGPRGAGYGGLRDVVLGLRAVLADGTSVRFGGRTMKNVAGYDMVKLLVGSFGVLGVVSEVTFRLLPQPEKQVLVICPLSSLDRGRELATWILDSPLRPLSLDVVSSGLDSTAGAGPPGAPARRGSSERLALHVGFAGSLAEVNRSVVDVCAQAGTDSVVVLEDDQAEFVYEALAESELVGEGGRIENSGGPAVTARATLPVGEVWAVAQTAESLARAGGFSLSYRVGAARGTLDLLVRGPGVVTGGTSFAGWAGDVRGAALRAGGRLAITGGLDLLSAGFDPWGVSGSSLELMRRLKERFDSHGLLSPGRFVGGI